VWTVDCPADGPFRQSIERIYERWTEQDIKGLEILANSKSKELREIGSRALADYRLWQAQQLKTSAP
jgi:hypothetical protein